MPLQLTDAEMDVLTSLAAPIAFGRRGEFLQAVAAAIEKAGGGSGTGLARRLEHEPALNLARHPVGALQRLADQP